MELFKLNQSVGHMSISLRQQLEAENSKLFIRLRSIETEARQLWEYSQAGEHAEFTPHGLSHISRVEQNAEVFLSEQGIKSLNPTEIFILLVSIFFHDAFMIPKSTGQGTIARDTHATNAKDNLREINAHLNLTPQEIFAVSEVIKGHAVESISEIAAETVIESELVDLRKLGAILSIADICHADAGRAPQIVFAYMKMSEESAKHWRRHFSIGGITRKGDSILVSAIAFSKVGESAIVEYVAQIQKQLEAVAPYFRSILPPISKVDLDLTKETSEAKRKLRFQADVSKILDLLTRGVYSRDDVFVRELLQNSFDACAIREANEYNSVDEYEAVVTLTILYDDAAKMLGLRIDDNGAGMSIGDFEDTLLWIGRSITEDHDLVARVEETTGRKLIARFGIGLLSCFKAAKKITVVSSKADEVPFTATITSILDEVRSFPAPMQGVGTTFILELKDTHNDSDLIFGAFHHYFRTSQFAHVYIRQELDREKFFTETRERYLELTGDEEELASIIADTEEDSSLFKYRKARDNFTIELNLSPFEFDNVATGGKVEVSNQGIYVTDVDTLELLPVGFAMLNGRIDLNSGVIDLAASRSDIVRNAKLDRLKEDISDLKSEIFSTVVREIAAAVQAIESENEEEHLERTKKSQRLKYFLVWCYREGDQHLKNAVTASLKNYPVLVGSNQVPLSSIDTSEARVFLVGRDNRVVSEAFTFDRKRYFSHVPSKVEFKEQVLLSTKHTIVEYVNFQEGWRHVSEKAMIVDWFKRQGVNPVDIVTEDPSEARLRSLPIPSQLRDYLGKNVKLVQTGNESRLAWHVDDELWVNISNRQMHILYSALRSGNLPAEDRFLVKILADVLSLKLDDAVHKLVATIATGRN